MIERSKTLLLLALVFCGVVSYAIGHIHVPDEQGHPVTLIAKYSYFYDILLGIGISIILAVGLNLVNGYTGQFSLGHAGFMAVGAYGSSWLTLSFGYVLGTGAFGTTTVFVAALIAGGIGAALAGLLVGVPSLRLRGDYLAIVTLGFNEIIKGVIQNAEPLGAQRGLGGMEQHTNFFWTFAFAAVTIYVVLNLVGSTYGRGFLAVRDDEIAAEAMGINTTKYKVIAFVLAAFFAGIAGGLYAHFKQFIHPEGFNFLRSVDIVVMVILGGMGNTAGVVVAATLLTILPEILRWLASSDSVFAELLRTICHVIGELMAKLGHLISVVSPHLGHKISGFGELLEGLPELIQAVLQNRMILYSVLLIFLMLKRPQGLFGNFTGKRNQRLQ